MTAPYRLQALLTLRERLKKRAEMALASCLKKLFNEREALKRLEEALDVIGKKKKTAQKEMKNAWGLGGVVGKNNVYVRYLCKLSEDEEKKKEEIEAQKEKIKEAEQKVALARADYIGAAKEHRMMQKHKELWEKKIRGELNAKEAKRLNELGNTIHSLRQWRGETGVFEVKS